jgi:rubrerythrin
MFLTSLVHWGRMAIVATVALLTLSPGLRAASTLENMQAAFNGESNAHARYLAFAQQADKEGYPAAANLFRAAARAEQIHAGNHAEVIRQLGAEPKAAIETPQVKSTRENLEAAVKGESYERDTMYPEFLKQARADGDAKAVRSLNLAKTAEAEHAKLYQAALDGLEASKGIAAKGFYVCPVCGFTTAAPDFKKCPSCFTAKEKFEKIA